MCTTPNNNSFHIFTLLEETSHISIILEVHTNLNSQKNNNVSLMITKPIHFYTRVILHAFTDTILFSQWRKPREAKHNNYQCTLLSCLPLVAPLRAQLFCLRESTLLLLLFTRGLHSLGLKAYTPHVFWVGSRVRRSYATTHTHTHHAHTSEIVTTSRAVSPN